MSSSISEKKGNPVVTLKTKAGKFDYSQLRTGKDNAEANSGYQAYKDFPRMDFVVNKKDIDQNFINQLYAKYASLIENDEIGEKNYHPFVKEVFKEMFKYAEAKVPNDSILEELVTNCNQAGYVGALYAEDKPLFHVATAHELVFGSSHTTYINCSDPSRATIRIGEKIAVCTLAKPEEELCKLDSSLEFTLESQDGKDDVTYKDGKLLLTVPRKLRDYKIDGRNLFDVIKEDFYKFCEKLGFKLKIEHNLDKPLEVNSHLESVEPPAPSNEHGNAHGPGN